jgi:hypothetical protein
MGSDATLKAKDGQVAEADGLSILDVVKHAVKTVIETLGTMRALFLLYFVYLVCFYFFNIPFLLR